MSLRSGNRQSIAGAQWGHWRFHTIQPEAGKLRGLFRQSPPGTLFYGSLPRNPHSPSPVLWGYGRFRITQPGMGAVP